MTVAVAPEVRAAQRRIVSTINASGKLNADGLAMWREVNCGEWKATAADIGRDLDLLQVPHTIATAFRFPLATSYSKAMREGEEVRILRKDLAHLVPWMPSLEQTVSDSLTELATLLPLVTAQGQDVHVAMAAGAPAAR
ncbi:hypothetical protein [Streptomyces sp. NPDC059349]|uniref:hypothetical protein n=1 Tax=Streptomyces sp. NPDC059349 TaxID=3346808 RepID=UPI0036B3385D